ncbi:hypothetical protein G9C98_002555 [Cotesia typhae]|uniref:Uncharacterized protein n=1 Tax=Cotesia typhae TaxID=2053667 RepID=A0A8J5R8D2_9HYME|nr:hypothetical protein G9C98_002555 [Cotesia typhae]
MKDLKKRGSHHTCDMQALQSLPVPITITNTTTTTTNTTSTTTTSAMTSSTLRQPPLRVSETA